MVIAAVVVGIGIIIAILYAINAADARAAAEAKRLAEAESRRAAEAAAQRAAAALLERQEEWDRMQQRLALTCLKCRSLSPPIPKSFNRYRCTKCGNQFAAAQHRQDERPE